jgi:hypothetical protein
MATTKKTSAKDEAPAFKMPTAPKGFKPVPLYRAMWTAKAGTCVSGNLLGVQPEEAPNGDAYTAIMCRVNRAGVPVFRFDETGSREELARVDEIIAINGSSPIFEKLIAMAKDPTYAHEIELWSVPCEGAPSGLRYVMFWNENPVMRSKVDPLAQQAVAHAEQAAPQPNGAG